MRVQGKKILQQFFGSSQQTQHNEKIRKLVQQWVAINGESETNNRITRNTIESKKKKLNKFLADQMRIGALSSSQQKKVRKYLIKEIDNTYEQQKQNMNEGSRVIKIGRKLVVYSSDEEEEPKMEQQQQVKNQQQSMQNSEQVKDVPETNHEEDNSIRYQKGNKKKYVTFDPEFKEEVCNVARQRGIDFAIKKYRLSARKINNWTEALSHNILGKGRKALDPAMEFNMSVWILKKIWNRVPLTQKTIRHKAASMSTLKRSFNGSKGWLEKFFLRHVQLKSCFDFRNKDSTREECARYHRCAFTRIMKDYENFSKIPSQFKNIVKGDLQEIIYKDGSHPILKLWNDKRLDSHRMGPEDLYKHEDLQKLGALKIEYKMQDVQDEEEFEGDQDSELGEDYDSQDEMSVKKQEQSDSDEVQYNLYEQSDQ